MTQAKFPPTRVPTEVPLGATGEVHHPTLKLNLTLIVALTITLLTLLNPTI